MPAKKRDFSVQLTGPWEVYQLIGPAWVQTNSGQFASRSASLVVNNPWRESKPPAPLVAFPTDRTLTASKTIYPLGYREWKVGRRTYKADGTNLLTPTALLQPGTVSQRSALLNEAIIDALQRLKDQRWNAGVALAEQAGVARMLTDAASLVYKTRNDLVNGRYQKAYNRFRKDTKYMSYPAWRRKYWNQVRNVSSVRKNKRIPSGWLYYHYGLKPTINDLDGAMTELIVGHQKNPEYYRGTVQGYAKSKQQFSLPALNSNGILFQRQHFNLESVRVIIPCLPKDNTFVSRLSQLGVTNPPEALWNGIPFSFVVDYFFSVGDYLSVLDSNVAWEFGDVIECYRDVKNVTVTPTYGGGVIRHSVRPGLQSSKQLIRVRHNAPYGPLGMVLPRPKRGGPSVTTISKLLSLVATSFGKTVRP